GAAHVLPLVEAFFVICGLEDALPPAPAAVVEAAPSLGLSLSAGGVPPRAADLAPGSSLDVSALAAQVAAAAAGP
ncbi:hypothetical protein, partial [Klebsiella pneumoniae]|uniref:hypothetical protein n=1 Tax=Klebsiella pneumoniae TaxID=573 RepID=UPI0025A1850F